MSKQKNGSATVRQGQLSAIAPEWWGVQNEKGEWAFANSVVVHYPTKEMAEAHAKTLSPRWSAKKFAD